MKYLFLFILIIAFDIIGFGQTKYELDLSDPGAKGSLKVDVYDNSIMVSGYDGDKVIIKLLDKKSKESNGEYVLSSDALQFDIYESNNEVEIVKRRGRRAEHVNFEILVPFNFSLDLYTYYGDVISVTDVNGIIKADAYYGDIFMQNIEGNAEVESFEGVVNLRQMKGSVISNNTQGETIVDFIELHDKFPMSFSSNKGVITLQLPIETKANISLKTHFGKVKSDFKLGLIQSQKRPDVPGDGMAHRSINGGGSLQIFVNNYFGDIQIRKRK